MTNSIGLDIGGTKIAAGVFDEGGRLRAHHSVQTPDNYQAFLDACVAVVDEVAGSPEYRYCNCIGVGVPGLVDKSNGTTWSSNIPYLFSHNIVEDLEERLMAPIRIENDINCVTYAESVDGAASGARSVFGLVLGTGVGGGLVYKGRVLSGRNGLAAEIGHLPLLEYTPADGPIVQCPCGHKGCVETFVSGPALARLYQTMTGKTAQAHEISALAEANDAGAIAVLDRYYDILARALLLPIYAYDPDVIVICGGVSAMKGLYTELPVRIPRFCMKKDIKVDIRQALHGPMAGLRGAAYLSRS